MEKFKFNTRAREVIAKIHSNWQTYSDLSLPAEEDDVPIKLEDLGISRDSLSEMNLVDFEDSLETLIMADTQLFIKLLYSQGYDLWLTQTQFPSVPTISKMKIIRSVFLLEKLKQLIEKDMC